MKNTNYSDWYIYKNPFNSIPKVFKGIIATYYSLATMPIIGPYWTRAEARRILKLWKMK